MRAASNNNPRRSHGARHAPRVYAGVALVALVLATAPPPAAAQIGETVCACSPSAYLLKLDLATPCSAKTLKVDAGIADIDCVTNPPFSGSPGDLTVTSVTFLELDQNLQLLTSSSVNDNLKNGDTVEFASYTADPSKVTSDSKIPSTVEVGVMAVDQNNKSYLTNWVVSFTNACDAYPVISVGDKMGWTDFANVKPPPGVLCPPAATPTAVPKPTLAPHKSPVRRPTVAPGPSTKAPAPAPSPTSSYKQPTRLPTSGGCSGSGSGSSSGSGKGKGGKGKGNIFEHDSNDGCPSSKGSKATKGSKSSKKVDPKAKGSKKGMPKGGGSKGDGSGSGSHSYHRVPTHSPAGGSQAAPSGYPPLPGPSPSGSIPWIPTYDNGLDTGSPTNGDDDGGGDNGLDTSAPAPAPTGNNNNNSTQSLTDPTDPQSDSSAGGGGTGANASTLAGVLVGGGLAMVVLGVGARHLQRRRGLWWDNRDDDLEEPLSSDLALDAKRIDTDSSSSSSSGGGSTAGLTTQVGDGSELCYLESHDMDSVAPSSSSIGSRDVELDPLAPPSS